MIGYSPGFVLSINTGAASSPVWTAIGEVRASSTHGPNSEFLELLITQVTVYGKSALDRALEARRVTMFHVCPSGTGYVYTWDAILTEDEWEYRLLWDGGQHQVLQAKIILRTFGPVRFTPPPPESAVV